MAIREKCDCAAPDSDDGMKTAHSFWWLNRRRALASFALASLVAASCQTSPPPAGRSDRPTINGLAEFYPSKLEEMDQAIDAAVAEGKLPGGVVWLERNGTAHHRAFGNRAVIPQVEAMTEDTIFDAASLTKVIATLPSIMLLAERGQLDLDAPVQTYLPEFTGDGKEQVTLRHLLTHTSGLRPGLPREPSWNGYERGIALACAEILVSKPGAIFRYSDINFILLGEVVRRASGQTLDRFASDNIFRPLKMRDTGFLPAADRQARIAPTERVSGDQVLRGLVHDPTSRRMGGVTGHAGLFLTAADLARFARMMLQAGELEGTRIFQPATIRKMITVQTGTNVVARRGLGWDIDSSYSGPRGKFFPIGSYGHTGWTGTSIWLDPFSHSFLIFLSNRNHPTESGSVLALRSQLGTLAAQAIAGFNFTYVPDALPPRAPTQTNEPPPRVATVLNGIDVLVQDNFEPLRNRRVGLITNHTGHDRERNPTIDLLRHAAGVALTVLFSPEHGIRGVVDEKVGDSTDQKTGLPIYSLYGDSRKPSRAQLKNLDVLVFDVQDIGCRFYTYMATMVLAMEAAADAGVKFMVLDRVNPITGLEIEGPIYAGPFDFTAYHSIPVRHGMTAGELANMFAAEKNLKLDLQVIALQGWQRAHWFDDTSLPWTNPSPNMRNLTEATLYPGIGLLETALSVGRGTDTPFELIGAPYIDDRALATELNRAPLSGVRFVPIRFTPKASVHKDQNCGGVYLVVTDRTRLRSVEVAIAIAATLHRLYPQNFPLEKVDRLLQHRPTLNAIRAGKSLAEIKQLWAEDHRAFAARRERYLLYR
jgi:uncharacterized protein YbbC (DUF1343 family)/CubicO group peptidase (beta-lactamase class C family)